MNAKAVAQIKTKRRHFIRQVYCFMKKGQKKMRYYYMTTVILILSMIIWMPHTTPAKTNEELTPQTQININTASKEELIRLKRIGPSLAERIIDYRETHGPFLKREDILNGKGLGQKFWEANKELITVGDMKAKME